MYNSIVLSKIRKSKKKKKLDNLGETRWRYNKKKIVTQIHIEEDLN